MSTTIIDTFSEEEIINIISTSSTVKEALQRFGYKKLNNRPLIERYAQKYNIDISHYSLKGRIIDLTGQTFGKLKVIELDNKLSGSVKYWRCKCECGNEISVRSAHLRNGNTKSCGCLKMKGKIKDLTGQRFNNIYVIGLDEKRTGQGKSAHWNVKCEKCGVIGSMRGDVLQERGSFNCNCKKGSKNEQLINEFLLQNNISFDAQYSFKDLFGCRNPLYFDFKINKNNSEYFLLEYQGEQHYKIVNKWGGEEGLQTRQHYDEKKRKYCEKNNIKLYEIRYDENTIEKLIEILKNEGYLN